MTTLSDLIARLEAAKEGSRELDAMIAVAIFETQKTDDDLIYARECARSDNCAAGTYWHVQRSGMSLRTAPSYTTSLDAALTLVPEDYGWSVSMPWRDETTARACVEENRRKYFDAEGKMHYGGHDAPAPALALCIAALKAREAAQC